MLQKQGSIPQRDMFNTYNMGVGMTVIVARDDADKALAALHAEGCDAYAIGEIVKGEEPGWSYASKARIAVFVSGGGTNLEALLKAQESGAIPHGEIVLVCASNESAYALTRAANHGVPAVAVPRKQMSQEAFERTLSLKLAEYRVDLIVLAGFLSILSADFVARWPERILNVHPSLIPAFCGKGYYGLKVHEAGSGAGREGHRRDSPSGQRDPRRRTDPAAKGCGSPAR